MIEKLALKWLSTCLLVILIAGLSFSLSLPVFAQTEKKQEPERIRMSRDAQKALYNAQEAMKIDKYVAAKNFLVDYFATLTPEEKLLEENVPVMYYYMLAQAWMAEDNLEEARKVFKEGLVRYPNDESLEINYAIMTYNTERFAEAAPLFEKLYDTRQGDKKDSRYLQQAAAAYYQIENLKEAKRVLKRMFALPEEPKPEWFQMMIQICMEQEEMKEAESYVLQYLNQDPLKADYWSLYAQLRLDADDYKGGASAMEISYQIKQPSKLSRWEDLSELYNYLNAPLKAAKSLESALKMEDSESNRLKLVEIYKRAQRFDKALSYLNRMIEKKPTDKLYFEKGRLLYDNRLMKEAITALDKCIDLNPKMGEAFILRGFAAWYLKDWREAQATFDEATTIRSVRSQANDALAVLEDLENAKHEDSKYR